MCINVSDCKGQVLEYPGYPEIYQQFPCEDKDIPVVRMGASQLKTQHPSVLVPFQTNWQEKKFIAMFDTKY
jgi:hypothetical protein